MKIENSLQSKNLSKIRKFLQIDTCASSQHFVKIQHIVSHQVALGRPGVTTRTD